MFALAVCSFRNTLLRLCPHSMMMLYFDSFNCCVFQQCHDTIMLFTTRRKQIKCIHTLLYLLTCLPLLYQLDIILPTNFWLLFCLRAIFRVWLKNAQASKRASLFDWIGAWYLMNTATNLCKTNVWIPIPPKTQNQLCCTHEEENLTFLFLRAAFDS